jgi:prevent-host-death family protein
MPVVAGFSPRSEFGHFALEFRLLLKEGYLSDCSVGAVIERVNELEGAKSPPWLRRGVFGSFIPSKTTPTSHTLALMTTYSHNMVMSDAKVSQLKAKLSAYLSEVRAGGTVVVYDRNTPIARLVPFREDEDDIVIVEASGSPSELKKIKGVRPKKPIDVDKLLRDLREDR